MVSATRSQSVIPTAHVCILSQNRLLISSNISLELQAIPRWPHETQGKETKRMPSSSSSSSSSTHACDDDDNIESINPSTHHELS